MIVMETTFYCGIHKDVNMYICFIFTVLDYQQICTVTALVVCN